MIIIKCPINVNIECINSWAMLTANSKAFITLLPFVDSK